MKQTAIEWFAEKDTELTIQFLEGKLNQIQLAIEKTKCLQQAKEMELSPFIVNGKKVTEQEFVNAVKNTPDEAFEYTGNDDKYIKMVEGIGGKTTEYFWNEACAWAVENFGLPGENYMTHPTKDNMKFLFKNEQH